MAKLYEYAILLEEVTDKDGKVTDKAELIAKGDLLARDEDQATVMVARLIPDDKMEDLERITLAVRPF